LARLNERPRLNRAPRQRKGSDGSDFGLIDWFRPVRGSHESHDARGYQDGETLVYVEMAKDVSGKKRHIDFDNAINSLALGAVKRRESSITLSLQPTFDNLFVPRSDV